LNKAINNIETIATQIGMETKIFQNIRSISKDGGVGSVPLIGKHSSVIRVPPSEKRCSLSATVNGSG